MADAKSILAFGRAAVNFNVHESDFLVLSHDNINTFESMAYRLPASGDLEDYLKRVLRTRCAYRDDENNIICYDRPNIVMWEDYKTLEDVGCVRKLWGMSTTVAKRHMERLAGDESETKIKVTLSYSQELEDKGVQEGLPEPSSDRERPSLHTLTKVHATFGPGGSFQHIPWESYVSMETENRLRRAGKLPRDRKELVVEDKMVKMSPTEEEFPETPKIDTLIALQDMLELRARAFHMLEVCPYPVAKGYGEKLYSYLRTSTAEGMRNPTMNEVRRADREIMAEVTKWVAKGKGTVEAGLSHYTNNLEGEPLGRLLAQQPENFPDQGKEKPAGDKVEKASSAESPSGGRKRPRSPEVGPKATAAKAIPQKPRMCIVCNKRHEPRCVIPPGFRQAQKKAKAAVRAKAAGGGADGGGTGR